MLQEEGWRSRVIPKIPRSDRSCLNCKHFTFNPYRTDKFGNPVRMNRECCFGLDEQGRTKPISMKWGRCESWGDMRSFWQRLRGERPQKGFC